MALRDLLEQAAFGLPLGDWLVILAYLLGITAIGTWAVRRVRSAATFFISDRRFGKVLMIFFNFGTGTHSDQAVSVAAKTYRVGASGIWYQLLWAFSTPFYWLIAPLFRRMRAITTADYFEARYDASVGVLYAVTAILNLIVNMGVMLKGSSAMIEAITGGQINAFWATMAMTAMFLIYGVAGGLSAAIITDFIQGILTILLSFLILPFALNEISRLTGLGPMQGMRHVIGDPAMFGLVSAEIGLFYIIVISLNGLIGYGCQPHTISLCAAGKTEMEARVGMTCGMFIKRFCTVAWVFTGLCAVAYYKIHQQPVHDVDHVFGLMARDILPAVAPGVVGLFIASMLAGVMSSCDAFMVAASALFTNNIYRRFFVRQASDRHYIFVGRLVAAAVVGAAIVFAFSLESVVEGLEIFWKVSAMMGLAFWVGLFWRRATPAAAWAGTLVGFSLMLFTSDVRVLEKTVWDFNARCVQYLPAFMLWEGKLYLPWQMIIYLVPSLVAIIMVSLLTPRVAKEKLDRFYACLRTPVGPGEPEVEPFTLPPGVEPAPRRVWFDRFDLEIPRLSLIGLLGLAITAVAVVLFIAGVYWIFSLGA